MAQREKEEAKLHAPETLTLTLCVNNCGFPGNPATNNMCQSCFQASTIAASPAPHSCSPRSSLPIRSPERAAEERDARTSEAPAAAVSAPAPARQVSRCSSCRKRVGLTGFRCRCGDLFCGEHRYSDRHDCSYDYKATARAAIARANPVVRAAKIVRV